MCNFCTNCGAPLKENSQFCVACGFRVIPQQAAAEQSAAPPIQNEPLIETPAQPIAAASAASPLQTAVTAAAALFGTTSYAPNTSGEMSFIHMPSPVAGVSAAIGPFKCIAQGAVRMFSNIKTSFKDVKRLIPALIMAVIWIVLIALPRFGVNPVPVQIMSFLTFAQGGISNDVVRMLGGIVGKGFVAYLVMALITPLLRGQNPFKSFAGGLRSTFGAYKNTASHLAPLLAGAGTAMVAYNFMAGYASPWKSMAAVAALLLTIRSAGIGNGFMMQFFNSLFRKSKNKKMDGKSILAGMTAGFALSIPLSAIPFVYVGYALGGLLLIASLIAWIVKKESREAAV